MSFPIRPVFVALALLARHGEPLLLTNVVDVLFRRITPEARRRLGLEDPPGPDDPKGWHAVYEKVRYRFHSICDAVDPSPLPKNRRLAPKEFVDRTSTAGPELAERGERLLCLVNKVIDASVNCLNREVRRKWKGSVAVDATVVPAFARPERRSGPQVVKHSADPDAAWYIRQDDQGQTKKREWG